MAFCHMQHAMWLTSMNDTQVKITNTKAKQSYADTTEPSQHLITIMLAQQL